TVGWSGRLNTETWDGSWETEFTEDGRDDFRKQYTTGSFSLQNRRPDGQVTLNGSMTRTQTPTSTSHRTTGSFRLHQQIFGSTRLTVTGDARVWEGTSAD